VNRSKTRIKLSLFLVLVGAIVYFIGFTHSGTEIRHTNIEQLAEHMQAFGIFSLLIGMCAIFVQTWIPIFPFVLIAGANMLVFGVYEGIAINYGMTCLAAVTSFAFARYYGHDWVSAKLVRFPNIQTFNERLEQKSFRYILLARLIPIIPSSLINFAAGMSKVKFRPFLFATMLGKLPIVVLESFMGYDLIHFREHKHRLFLLLFLFLVLLGVGSWIRKKWMPRKTNVSNT
jgi:uncharacterized membrane protein YdjX (TVP38/TMEM64 family)